MPSPMRPGPVGRFREGWSARVRKACKWLENSAESNFRQPQATAAFDCAFVYEADGISNSFDVFDAENDGLCFSRTIGKNIVGGVSNGGDMKLPAVNKGDTNGALGYPGTTGLTRASNSLSVKLAQLGLQFH